MNLKQFLQNEQHLEAAMLLVTRAGLAPLRDVTATHYHLTKMLKLSESEAMQAIESILAESEVDYEVQKIEGGKKVTKQLIPAVGYLRKSTSGDDGKGGQRQEKSIPRQKKEIEQLAADRGYKILRWYADPGKSGWKRGAQRPDFTRMIADAQERQDVQAILCEQIDRFSRAEVDEVQQDAFLLKQAGVKVIVSRSEGEFPIGSSDIGQIIRFVVSVWSSNQFSRKLSDRVLTAQRNKAEDGQRCGGAAPLGMKLAGTHKERTLEAGDPEELELVQQIFQWYGKEGWSMNGIADELNRRKVKTPKGAKRWYTGSVAKILTQPAYKGQLVFNRVRGGRFHVLTPEGRIVPAEEAPDMEGAEIVLEGQWKPIIDPKLWEKVQNRMQQQRTDNRKPRKQSFALSGILRCAHCGGMLYGCRTRVGTVYRCGSVRNSGVNSCLCYEINERKLLPPLVELLREELGKLSRFHIDSVMPPEVMWPELADEKERRQLKRELDQLDELISRAQGNLALAENPSDFKAISDRLKELRAERKALARQGQQESTGPKPDTRQQLHQWLEAKLAECCLLPASESDDPEQHYFQDGQPSDPRKLNQALHDLGLEVELFFKTRTWESSKKKTLMRRHELVRWRVRLGQKTLEKPYPHFDTQGSLGIDIVRRYWEQLRNVDVVLEFGAV